MSQSEADSEILAVANAVKRHIGTVVTEPIIVSYEFVDTENQLPPGTTEKYIEEAAREIGYVVARKGTTRASLIKNTGGTS